MLPVSCGDVRSVATQLSVAYHPTLVNTTRGAAVTLLSGSGSRTFINRFGVATSTAVALASTVSSMAPFGTSLLYLNSPIPVDSSGLILLFSQPIQLPGAGPGPLYSSVTLYNSSAGAVVESNASRVDGLGSAFLSSVPGFTNVTISASNINALAAQYAACQAPITFTNGLRQPIQPTSFNGAAQFSYSYFLSDGATYTVQANLTVTTSSPFAATQDLLGNPYLTVLNVVGTRVYTFLPTGAQLSSGVDGLCAVANTTASQRFYPYALLSSAPGVHTMANAPFLDALGLDFYIVPSAPYLGAPVGPGYYQLEWSCVRLYFSGTAQVLTEAGYTIAPLFRLQQQLYSLN
jgi:hypothetical protein